MITIQEFDHPISPKKASPKQSFGSPEQQIAAYKAMILEALKEALEDRTQDVLMQHTTNNPMLWSALTRTATALLMDAKTRGLIESYKVRCDEETASWGTPESPVVEILIKFPIRVSNIKFDFK